MSNTNILKKEDLQWIGIRLQDTNSNTFLYEGQYYKAILPTAEDYIKNERYDLFLDSLYNENFIPKTSLTNLQIEGLHKVYAQYTEYFHAPFQYTNPLVLQEAALLYIKMNIWLHKRGFIVFDGHTSNMVVQKQDAPYWCDIGSIKTLTKKNEYTGIDEFIRYFIYPILLRSKCYSLGDMMRYSLIYGMNHDTARALRLLTKPLILDGSRLEIFQNLQDLVESIEFPWEKTLWSDYGANPDTDTNIPDIVQDGHNRKAMIMRLLKTLAPKTVIDLGANAGGFSRLAASLGAQVLALEPDETAIANGHTHLRQHKADNPIKFVCSGLFTLHKPADVAMALALTHHVFLTDRFPWSYIAKTLAEHTNKHLITEFMPNGLGRTKKQNNLPAQYTLENFVEQLNKYFENVEIIDYLHCENSSPRIMLLCTNKKNI